MKAARIHRFGPPDVIEVEDIPLRSLGAAEVIDYGISNFADAAGTVNVVIDTVGGETRERAFGVLKPGGILVTVVSGEFVSPRSDVRSAFSYADVTTARLSAISGVLEWQGRCTSRVCSAVGAGSHGT